MVVAGGHRPVAAEVVLTRGPWSRTLLTVQTVFSRVVCIDDPAAASTLTTERNVNAQDPKEGLGATQAASERAGIFGPAGARPRNPVIVATGAGPQKVGGAACPRTALSHNLPHASGDRVGVDNAVDRGPAVRLVGAPEGPRRPKRRFAGRCPQREISHAGQAIQADLGQCAQSMHNQIEEVAEDAWTSELELPP